MIQRPNIAALAALATGTLIISAAIKTFLPEMPWYCDLALYGASAIVTFFIIKTILKQIHPGD